ncbi:sugar-binding protein [Caballeronia sp. LZ025]|uniref:sugar-binding protein n=1 Tax=Caballeronia TaxID=1827195 RepID=UPI001FD2D988|nr:MULTISPECIES: sugar-binding protein [Caballeronia]MDR5733808.1 sugar-binding protein [Caballeronia sp. LZ025]
MKTTPRIIASMMFALCAAFGSAANAKEAKDISVAVIPKVAVPFFDDCNKGAQSAADKAGVKYQWVVPQNTQGSTQVQIIEDLISRHVDGIAISVNEPKSVESVMKRAAQSGVKVLTYDSDSPKSGRSMYIGTNNVQAGETMADTMGHALNGKGEVAIITGQLGAVNLNERITGIKKGLAKYPGIKIVETQGTDDDLARGVSVVETTLRAHPDLNGIFGVSQVGGPAVAKVLNTKEFGAMKGKLQVLAFDDLPDTLKGLKEGYIQGIMVQRPVTMGSLAVQHLVAQIQGKETQEKDIDTGVTVVTKDNIGSYTK